MVNAEDGFNQQAMPISIHALSLLFYIAVYLVWGVLRFDNVAITRTLRGVGIALIVALGVMYRGALQPGAARGAFGNRFGGRGLRVDLLRRDTLRFESPPLRRGTRLRRRAGRRGSPLATVLQDLKDLRHAELVPVLRRHQRRRVLGCCTGSST